MTRIFALCALALLGCPSNPSADGGSGGGSGGGTVSAGGGTGGAATGGGSGGATGGGSGGGDAGLAGIPFAQFCRTAIEAQCDWGIACGKTLLSERGDCIAQLLPICEWEMDHARNSSALQYDPAHGAACVAGFAAKNCGTYYAAWPLPICYGLGITQTPFFDAGSSCSASPVYGASCDYTTSYCSTAPFAACGVCTPFPQPGVQPGGLCDYTVQRCSTGNYCAYQADGGPPRCEVIRANGDPANGNDSCPDGILNISADGGYVCGYAPAGQACGLSTQCVKTHFCLGVSFTALGVCTLRTPLGQSCVNRGFDDGCAGGTCLGGVCVSTTGINFNTVDAGGECEGYTQCRSDERCVFDGGTLPIREGRCVPRLAVSMPCTDVQQCVTSAYCHAGTCHALGGDGEPCYLGNGEPCRAPYLCLPVDDGGYQCTAYATLGQPCSYVCKNADAGRAVCAHADGGSSGICTDPLANGTPCDNDQQCAGFVCASLDGGTERTCQSGCFP